MCTTATQTPFVIMEPTIPALWDPNYTPANIAHDEVNQYGNLRHLSHPNQIDSLVKRIIRETALGYNNIPPAYTAVGVIINRLLTIIGGTSKLSALNISRPEAIPSILEHQRLVARINASVWTFVRVRPIVTLYEISLLIERLCPAYSSVLGPLTSIPVVIETLELSPYVTMPPQMLVASDIIQHLIDWAPARFWRTHRSDTQRDFYSTTKEAEFAQHISIAYGVAGLPYLGLRIRFFPELVRLSFMCVKEYDIRRIEKKCENRMHMEISNSFSTFIQTSFGTNLARNPQFQQYNSMSPLEAIGAIFTRYQAIYLNLKKYFAVNTGGSATLKKINKILSLLSADDSKVTRYLFYLAVVLSKRETETLFADWATANLPPSSVLKTIQEDNDVTIVDDLDDDDCYVTAVSYPSTSQSQSGASHAPCSSSDTGATADTSEEGKSLKLKEDPIVVDLVNEDKEISPRISEVELLSLVQEQVDSLSRDTGSAFFDWETASSIEGRVMACLHSRNLTWASVAPSDSLTFLQYLIMHKDSFNQITSDIKMDENDSSENACVSEDAVSTYLASVPNLSTYQFTNLVQLVCWRFKIKECPLLVQRIKKGIQRCGASSDEVFPIIDEAARAYFDCSHSVREQLIDSHPALGHLSRASMILLLASCPPLECVAQWSQWDLIFSQVWGDLDLFLLHNALSVAERNIRVLRTSNLPDRRYLRLYSRPSLDLLSDQLSSLGVQLIDASCTAKEALRNACCQLVSLWLEVRPQETNRTQESDLKCLDQHRESIVGVVRGAMQEWSAIGMTLDQFVDFLGWTLQIIPSDVNSSLLLKCLIPCVISVVKTSDHEPITQNSLLCLLMERTPAPALSTLVHVCHRIGLLGQITPWTQHFVDTLIVPVTSVNLSQDGTVSTGSSKDSIISTVQSKDSAVFTSQSKETIDLGSQIEIVKTFYTAPSVEVNTKSAATVDFTNEQDNDITCPTVDSMTPKSPDAMQEDDAPSRDDVSETASKKAIVEDIRRKEFGLDLELSGEAKDVLENYQARLGRSLDHLSMDLYARQCHFLLELIQNADDNMYPDSLPAGGPSLHFCLTASRLIIRNNEMGFTEADLRALCDIGRSTKTLNRTDKIGRKGIGFKSVFHVSRNPEIHSNGFHIRFVPFSGPAQSRGALVPLWTPPEPAIVAVEKEWCTQIVLPLESTTSLTRDVITEGLHKMAAPNVLLFLRRLNQIAVHIEDTDGNQATVTVLQRVQSDSHFIEISQNGTLHRWFLSKSQFPCQSIAKQLRHGDSLSHTGLTIAIPLTDPLHQQQPLFAYLPLRSFGLRFIINGDFEIPASREDIAVDSSWNSWLLSKVPEAFIDALETVIKLRSSPSTVQGSHDNSLLNRFLSVLPLSGEVTSSLLRHEIVSPLRPLLSAMAWLPDTLGQLRPPRSLLLPEIPSSTHSTDNAAQKISSHHNDLFESLRQRLDLHILDPDFLTVDWSNSSQSPHSEANTRRMTQLNWLGCRKLGLDEWIEYAATLTREDVLNPALLVQIFVTLETAIHQSDAISQRRAVAALKRLPLLPLENGSVVSPQKCPVYMRDLTAHSESDQDKFHKSLVDHMLPWLPLVQSCIACVDEEELNVPIRSFLVRLGVSVLSQDKLVQNILLPRIAALQIDGAEILSIDEEPLNWLIVSTLFLLSACPDHQLVGLTLPLLTATNTLRSMTLSSSQPIYFSPVYTPHLTPNATTRLWTLFPNVQFSFLSPVYLTTIADMTKDNCTTKFVVPIIVQRLKKLGVEETAPSLQPRHLIWPRDADILSDDVQTYLKEALVPMSLCSVAIEDFVIPNLSQFLTPNSENSIKMKWSIMEGFLDIIKDKWNSWRSKSQMKFTLVSDEGIGAETDGDSLVPPESPFYATWIRELSSSAWIPAAQCGFKSLSRPDSIFPQSRLLPMSDDSNLQLDATLLNCCALNISDYSLIRALGFRTSVTTQDLKDVLTLCISNAASQVTLPAMKSLYLCLLADSTLDHVFLRSQASIYLPASGSAAARFVCSVDVYWDGFQWPTSRLSTAFKNATVNSKCLPLCPIYGPSLERLFIDIYQVSRFPPISMLLSMGQHLNHWKHVSLAGFSAVQSSALFTDITAWYACILKILPSSTPSSTIGQSNVEQEWEELKNAAMILCSDGKWRSAKQCQIYAWRKKDNCHLFQTCAQRNQIAFLGLSERFLAVYDAEMERIDALTSGDTDNIEMPLGGVESTSVTSKNPAFTVLFDIFKLPILDELISESVVYPRGSSTLPESQRLADWFYKILPPASNWLAQHLSQRDSINKKQMTKDSALDKLQAIQHFHELDRLLIKSNLPQSQYHPHIEPPSVIRELPCHIVGVSLYVQISSVFCPLSNGEGDWEIKDAVVLEELCRFLFQGSQERHGSRFKGFLLGFIRMERSVVSKVVLPEFLSSHGIDPTRADEKYSGETGRSRDTSLSQSKRSNDSFISQSERASCSSLNQSECSSDYPTSQSKYTTESLLSQSKWAIDSPQSQSKCTIKSPLSQSNYAIDSPLSQSKCAIDSPLNQSERAGDSRKRSYVHSGPAGDTSISGENPIVSSTIPESTTDDMMSQSQPISTLSSSSSIFTTPRLSVPRKIRRLTTDMGTRLPLVFPSTSPLPTINLRVQGLTTPLSSVDTSNWRPLLTPPSNHQTEAVGRWGEELVYNHLLSNRFLGSIPIKTVQWANEEGEIAAPYDLLVTLDQPWPQSANNEVYIEVKTTSDQTRRDFDISILQLEMACAVRGQFHIFRVFHSPDPAQVQIDHIPDVYGQLITKAIALKMLF